MRETDGGATNSSNTAIKGSHIVTVGESLDNKIKCARQRVEELCVTKAKAEALGILDYPQEFIDQLSYGGF